MLSFLNDLLHEPLLGSSSVVRGGSRVRGCGPGQGYYLLFIAVFSSLIPGTIWPKQSAATFSRYRKRMKLKAGSKGLGKITSGKPGDVFIWLKARTTFFLQTWTPVRHMIPSYHARIGIFLKMMRSLVMRRIIRAFGILGYLKNPIPKKEMVKKTFECGRGSRKEAACRINEWRLTHF